MNGQFADGSTRRVVSRAPTPMRSAPGPAPWLLATALAWTTLVYRPILGSYFFATTSRTSSWSSTTAGAVHPGAGPGTPPVRVAGALHPALSRRRSRSAPVLLERPRHASGERGAPLRDRARAHAQRLRRGSRRLGLGQPAPQRGHARLVLRLWTGLRLDARSHRPLRARPRARAGTSPGRTRRGLVRHPAARVRLLRHGHPVALVFRWCMAPPPDDAASRRSRRLCSRCRSVCWADTRSRTPATWRSPAVGPRGTATQRSAGGRLHPGECRP